MDIYEEFLVFLYSWDFLCFSPLLWDDHLPNYVISGESD